ncbi:MAG: glutathione S-transferase family protein [Gammaproteobacteria bacterium]|nr:glutathione S-transferase family protein [Gammaproteobacteria bacterium]
MKLYYAETPNPRKPCAVAKYLQSPVEYVRVDLRKGEHQAPAYLAINPNGNVPALEDGALRLWESCAIMCYLARRAESDLWPNDERQIDIVRWLSWDIAHFSRTAGTLFFEHVVKRWIGGGDPDPAAVEEATAAFKQYAAVLNDHLQGRKYLVGTGLTVADFAVASLLPYADQSHLPLDKFTEIQRWHVRINELEAWREPFPIVN